MDIVSDTELWGDLVVSILSVNKFSLEKAYARVGYLRLEGLCAIENLGTWNIEEISMRLVRAGVNRGSFMNAEYAKRLCALGVAVKGMNLAAVEGILRSRDRQAISKFLLPIPGIGTMVVNNFFILREG